MKLLILHIRDKYGEGIKRVLINAERIENIKECFDSTYIGTERCSYSDIRLMNSSDGIIVTEHFDKILEMLGLGRQEENE